MSPAYNELGYNEHAEHFWLTSMFKKFGYNECRL